MSNSATLNVLGETTAWMLIGFEGSESDIEQMLGIEHDMDGKTLAHVRIKGGRTLYENVDFNDSTRGDKVRLGRLDSKDGLHPVYRWVHGDTILEVVVPS